MGVDSILTGVPDSAKLEVVKTGTVDLPFAADGSTEQQQIAHGLDYAPIVLASLISDPDIPDDIRQPLPLMLIEGSGADAGKVLQLISYHSDKTYVYFFNQSQLQGTAGGTIRYYLLRIRSV